jgi:hypothetical protein
MKPAESEYREWLMGEFIKHGIGHEIYSIHGWTNEARELGHLAWVKVDASIDGSYHHIQSQLQLTKEALKYLENNDGK